MTAGVRAHALDWSAKNVLIEDRASGTQLIQDLRQEGMSTLTRDSTSEKVIRMSTSSNMIENGYVYLPEHAPWLAIYLHEMVTFDHGNQALGSGETVQNSPRWLGIIAVKEGGFRPSQSV